MKRPSLSEPIKFQRIKLVGDRFEFVGRSVVDPDRLVLPGEIGANIAYLHNGVWRNCVTGQEIPSRGAL